MREPVEPTKPGEELKTSLAWREDDPIRPGAKVRATDGPLGTVRERRMGEGPEHAYLGVDTDEGLVYVPERLVRETAGDTILLSVPAADAKAQGSHDQLPIRTRPDEMPREP